MQSDFDVRKHLKIDKRRPVELRICHIAELWYGAVLSERMQNHLDTIYNLFPDLVIVEGYRSGDSDDLTPEFDRTTNYITAYRTGGYLNQAGGDVIPPIINCLYGSVKSPKQKRAAIDIQKRVSSELCRDISLLTVLRRYYTRLILDLSPEQLDDFKNVFKTYINAVTGDLEIDSKEIDPDYETTLFPFESDNMILDFNNEYLSKEFKAGNYADFFLWMNLGALLRNEIRRLTKTYDSSFNLKKTRNAPSQAKSAKSAIPRCLTKIPPVSQTVGLVGREDVKEAVRSMLEERGRMALVSGLGGIGKTAVMQYVCNDLKEEGKYVAWIDCGDSLKRDLLSLGAALGIDTGDPDSAYDQILLAVKTRLNGALYLFLDDLTEDLTREELGGLNSLNAHIMSTSRKVYDAFPAVRLEVLDDGPVVTMFFRYYNGDTDRRYEDTARRIVSSVGRHTLLVELLACAAKRSGGTLEDFNTRLEAEGVYDVFKRKIDTAHDEKMTIEDCAIRLYETSSLSDAQKHIMRLFSIFTPGKEIYYKVSEWAGLDMDAMDELIDLGWIEMSGSENNYKMHQIIRDSIALQMRRQGKGLRIEDYGDLLKRVADTGSYMPRGLEYTKVQERLVLAEDVAKYLKSRTVGEPSKEENPEEQKAFFIDAASLFHNMASVYSYRGDYEKALEYYGKALAIRERVLGPEHPDTAATYNNMADIYRGLSDYESALEFYGKALAIRKRVLGPEHPDTATTYNNMAVVYSDQIDYERSLVYCGKALAIREVVLGSMHPDTATTYNNMALVYSNLGDYERALELYMKALEIDKNVLGSGHPDTAAMYNNMALVYHALGDYGKALKFYGKALYIYERVLGPDHPFTTATYNNMANVYVDLGDYGKAMEFYGNALAIREQMLGTGHPDTAAIYSNIASVFRLQGDYERALECYSKALSIRDRETASENIDTAETYKNIAVVYDYQGDYKKAMVYCEKALEFYRKALDIYKHVLGPEHPDTASTYNNMAMVYFHQGDHGNALYFYDKALSIRERVLGSEHPDTASTYNNIAMVYFQQSDYEWALEYYGKALSIRESVLGTTHPDTASTYNNIAMVYSDQHNYARALEYYGKALSIRESVLGFEHLDTASTYNNMARMYSNQHNYARALAYYGKALSIRESVLGTTHPSTAMTYNDMADAFLEQGNYERAEEFREKARAIREHVLGTGNPTTATTYNNMADAFRAQDNYKRVVEFRQKFSSKIPLIQKNELSPEYPHDVFDVRKRYYLGTPLI